MLLLIVCHKVGNQIQLQHVLVIGRRIVTDNLQELIDAVTSCLVLLLCLYLCHNLYVFNVLNLVIFFMCADKPHIDLLVDEQHNGHYTVVIALDIEHVTVVAEFELFTVLGKDIVTVPNC
jgi:hypothetical protein